MQSVSVLKQLLAVVAVAAGCSSSRAAVKLESATFDANGVKIHYLTAGSGEPVILIHGLDSSAEINWNLNGVIAELSTDHRVVAFDMPGHGRSDKPAGESAYGRHIVDDVVLLMDHLKIER